ncbi:MAG: DUF4258 domain-containing protein [Pseudomonadota bacterium]
MSRKHLIPGDPLQFIRTCVIQRKILWTYHVNMRLKGRSISRDAIVNSHDRYEIIERYPNDKYFPSCLVRSEYQDDILHILFAVDEKNDNIRIITAYRPTLGEWEDGFKIRRRSS